MIGYARERIDAGAPMPGVAGGTAVIEVIRCTAIGEAIKEIILVLECSEPSELGGRILFVPMPAGSSTRDHFEERQTVDDLGRFRLLRNEAACYSSSRPISARSGRTIRPVNFLCDPPCGALLATREDVDRIVA